MKIREAIRAYNAARLERLMESLRVQRSDLLERVRRGEAQHDEIKRELKSSVRDMDHEERIEAAARLREEQMQRTREHQAALQKLREEQVQRERQRLEELRRLEQERRERMEQREDTLAERQERLHRTLERQSDRMRDLAEKHEEADKGLREAAERVVAERGTSANASIRQEARVTQEITTREERR